MTELTQVEQALDYSSVGKWKAYLNYKDSGVEWLGEIPAHWEIRPLKYITRFINGAAFKPNDWKEEGVPIIRIENLNGGEEFHKSTMILDSRYFVGKGDLLFGWSGNRGTSFGPFIWEFEGRYYLNQHIFRLEGFDEDKYWLYWQLKAVTVYVESQAHGIIGLVHITKQDLGSIYAAKITVDEQNAIASFLDRETTRISTLIAKKQRLIELLQEKRAALISHAVTKGLDPDVKMKDSGVEWLGEIPTHWEVRRLKFVVSESLKYGANESAEFDDVNLPRYIRITDIDEAGSLKEDSFKSLPEEIARHYLLKQGDILFARSGATVGKTFLYQYSWGRACYAGYLIRARINPQVALSKFVYYFTTSSIYWNWLASVFSQATIQNVNAEKYGNLIVSLPPVKEQQAIISYLEQETARIDALIAKIGEAIEKLKEYSAALISAAVTGKIDVRGEVAITDEMD